jgi:hypothetical protein
MEVVKMAEKIKPAEKVDDLTPVQRLAKLDAERKELFDGLKSDALQKANEAVTELNALGFHYLLCEEGTKTNGSTKGTPSDAACPICTFKTKPPHDKRSHKKSPGPFTDEELAKRGLVRVPV